MTTYTSIHRIKEISAKAIRTLGSPFSIITHSEDDAMAEITFYTDSAELSRKLADVINATIAEHREARKSEAA